MFLTNSFCYITTIHGIKCYFQWFDRCLINLSATCFQAGSVEGQVVNIGLMSTQLLDNDKFPVIVPNSFFSSQVANLYGILINCLPLNQI